MAKPKDLFDENKLLIFYSGSMMGPSQPERALWAHCQKKPGVMLTYWEMHRSWRQKNNRINETMRRIKRLRRQRRKERLNDDKD